jgi:hypothetical protein
MEYRMSPEIADDLRAQGMAAIACWLERDKQGWDAVVGSDEEAAVLLPICISELCTALERLTGPADLRHQVSSWLDEHRRRLREAA